MPEEFDPTDVSTWSDALIADHSLPVEDRHIARRIVDQDCCAKLYTNPASAQLFDGNTLWTVFDILCDNHLAGFSKEDLTSSTEVAQQRRKTVVVVSRSMNLLGLTYAYAIIPLFYLEIPCQHPFCCQHNTRLHVEILSRTGWTSLDNACAKRELSFDRRNAQHAFNTFFVIC